jgi:SAM-dependent methyltransferase
MSFFNSAYRGTPPWDIGRPQREFVRLAEEGKVRGDVVDLGCGTGENAMMFAEGGNRVLGIDSAPLAITKAKAKALERRSLAQFLVADALNLPSLGRYFDVATDCGLFHTFSDHERKDFANSLGAVLRPGGRYFMLCFSDREPADWGGPRRVTKDEIIQTFSSELKVDSIRPARFEAFQPGNGGHAWLASLTKREPAVRQASK